MQAAPDSSHASILIVDDKAANVQLLERVLRGAGYARLSSTTNPLEVGALHREHRYDLILLDLQMPAMDGFQVMQELGAIEGESYLPVIVLTAEPGHKLRALQAGAKDFISKPFELLEVTTRIHHMLEVRLLHKALARANEDLERTVQRRTAELRASEQRFRRLTELASDWYWEQNETGDFTQVAGPVIEMLGVRMAAFLGRPGAESPTGWNEADRQLLQDTIAARQPFLNFAFSRVNEDGSRQHFRMSGEPIFDPAQRFTGYRGIGVQVAAPN